MKPIKIKQRKISELNPAEYNPRQLTDKQYKQLIEDAYNFRQTDSALSDIFEYNALKLLDKLNRLKYLSREPLQTIS